MSENRRIRVRFAPSPTGHLHIGGARTALFNWLFARGRGGSFVLRIEDTDRSRSTDEYIDSIVEGMEWLGLNWDEGPLRQTDRLDVYKKYIAKLLAGGKAYHCYCSPEELEERRKEAMAKGLPVKYDRRCLKLQGPVEGRAPSVRFMMPAEGSIVVDDMVRGSVTFENSQLDDLIIMRSDGTPTYNLVVVVDDVDMRITHVIRGDDHLNNTPRQYHIYKALGFDVPMFAHLPMILGSDKTRLSKRHGATSVLAYRDAGYLPGALVNYLVRLGWSHGDQEVFTRGELVKLFSFENVGKSAAVFNPEKLLWLNGEYIKQTPPVELFELARPFLIKHGTIGAGDKFDEEWTARAVGTLVERAKTLEELAASLRYYIAEDVQIDEKARGKFLSPDTLPYLESLRKSTEAIENFNESTVEGSYKSVMEEHGIKLGKVAQPARVALTGGTESPGIYDVELVLGKEKTLRRLQRAIDIIKGEMHE